MQRDERAKNAPKAMSSLFNRHNLKIQILTPAKLILNDSKRK